jgi:Fe-S-cluster formation regulator IscX/YfhJ
MEKCYMSGCASEAVWGCSCKAGLIMCLNHLMTHNDMGHHSLQLLHTKLDPVVQQNVVKTLSSTILSIESAIFFVKNKADSLMAQIQKTLENTVNSLVKHKKHCESMLIACKSPKGITKKDYYTMWRLLKEYGSKDLYYINDISPELSLNPTLVAMKSVVSELGKKVPERVIKEYAAKIKENLWFKEIIESLSRINVEKFADVNTNLLKILSTSKENYDIEKMQKPDKTFFSDYESCYEGLGIFIEKPADYSANPSLSPIFAKILSSDIAQTIIETGKNLKSLSHVLPVELPKLFFSSSIIGFVQSLEFTFPLINRELVSTLLTKYEFHQHLKLIKQFFLLGQGDFFYLLLEEIYLHNRARELESLFEECVFRSNAGMISEKFLRKIKLKHDEEFYALELDSYNFSIKLDYPLSLFISKEVVCELKQVFSVLFQTRRVDLMLKRNWYKRRVMNLKLGKEVKGMIQKMNIFQHRICMFMNILLYYFMEEVVENTWKTWKTEVSRALNLEEIDLSIKRMIWYIKAHVFLDSKDITEVLYEIFENIDRFIDLQREICESLSCEDNDDSEYSESFERFKEIEERFNAKISSLIGALMSHSNKLYYNLRLKLNEIKQIR